MPGYAPAAILPPFSPVVTQEAIKSTPTQYPAEHVIQNLLSIADYLITIVNSTNLFGPNSDDAYVPSLKTLYDRLHAGRLALTPLPDIAKDSSRLKQTVGARWTGGVNERPLEDFEDLYYAVLGRMQDILHTLNVRLSSGFNNVNDALFVGGPSITDFAASLAEYWDVFNSAECARALNDAVRQARVNRLFEEIHLALEANEITQADADDFLAELFQNKDETDGMQLVGGWSPAMIGAYLDEKYRVLLHVEKEEDERQAREIRKRARVKVKVRKEKRRSPTRRSSLEMMLEGARDSFARLREDGDGGVEVFRPSPGKQVRLVQQVEDAIREHAQQVDHDNNLEENVDPRPAQQERVPRGQLQHDIDWQLKSQRVSEYSSYLRGAASRGARSIINGSVYSSSVRGSSIGGPVLGAAKLETDMMEF
ncbi:hypothetical protein FB567DRAFT_607336 [Paraphoma chrysanthemicola]|uniref:Uncharacterized protein n=1 Tax=Paraphoma chrysanthemicola TaxID=798071 RepID=A0A8K0QZP6_9PLEO|nr:hypothetical protein FB567DRAFT_607336 [Paraphoma chrysanthemicola]